jgi:hypothetical protein
LELCDQRLDRSCFYRSILIDDRALRALEKREINLVFDIIEEAQLR